MISISNWFPYRVPWSSVWSSRLRWEGPYSLVENPSHVLVLIETNWTEYKPTNPYGSRPLIESYNTTQYQVNRMTYCIPWFCWSTPKCWNGTAHWALGQFSLYQICATIVPSCFEKWLDRNIVFLLRSKTLIFFRYRIQILLLYSQLDV